MSIMYGMIQSILSFILESITVRLCVNVPNIIAYGNMWSIEFVFHQRLQKGRMPKRSIIKYVCLSSHDSFSQRILFQLL